MFGRQSATHCTGLIPCGRNECLRSREIKLINKKMFFGNNDNLFAVSGQVIYL